MFVWSNSFDRQKGGEVLSLFCDHVELYPDLYRFSAVKSECLRRCGGQSWKERHHAIIDSRKAENGQTEGKLDLIGGEGRNQ